MTFPEKKATDHSIATVVIDFDNTVAESLWPSNEIGKPIEVGVEAIIHYHGLGNEVVIYTARPASHSGSIWRWLTNQGLNSAIHDVVCGKPRGWIYIDDRAWNPFEGDDGVAVSPGDGHDPNIPSGARMVSTATTSTDASLDYRSLPKEPSGKVRSEEQRRHAALAAAEGNAKLWESMD